MSGLVIQEVGGGTFFGNIHETPAVFCHGTGNLCGRLKILLCTWKIRKTDFLILCIKMAGSDLLEQLARLLQESLYITPNSKTGCLSLENLRGGRSGRSGMIQHSLINNLDHISLYSDSGGSSAKSLDVDTVRLYAHINEPQEKLKELERIHHEGQEVMRQFCDYMEQIVRTNRSCYQSQLCRIAGIDTRVDKNWTGATVLNLLVQQGRLEKYTSGRNVYFKVLNDGGCFWPIPFVDPSTKGSKLEARFAALLIQHGYVFEQQVCFPDLKYKKRLRLDFKVEVPDIGDVYVEIQGRQHYEHVKYFHPTEEDFKAQQLRDNIKAKYMKDNELYFLRIRYDEDQWKAFTGFIKTLG